MYSLRAKAMSLGLVTALALAPLAAMAEGKGDDGRGGNNEGGGANNPLRDVAVTGTAANGQPFAGKLDIQRFQLVNGQLLALGDLSGKVGNRPIEHQAVALPVNSVNSVPTGAQCTVPQGGFGGSGALLPRFDTRPALLDGSQPLLILRTQAACPILNLSLGALDLNLLGLVVTLAPVNLNIVAQSGAGNLLGNLLCDVANLLNQSPLNLGGLSGLLNQVTNILNGVLGAL